MTLQTEPDVTGVELVKGGDEVSMQSELRRPKGVQPEMHQSPDSGHPVLQDLLRTATLPRR